MLLKCYTQINNDKTKLWRLFIRLFNEATVIESFRVSKALRIGLFLLYTLSGATQAQVCNSTLTLGLSNIWPPYYFEIDAQPTGADIDIVKMIFSQANICLKYRKMPSSARALIELEKGSVDFLYAASFSEERQRIATFSIAYRNETVRIFWRPNGREYLAGGTLKSMFLSGLVVAINRGSFVGSNAGQLLKLQNESSVISVPTIEQRMRMLMHQRVDFIIEDELAGLYYIRKEKLSGIELHPYIIYQNDISLMFSRNISQQKIASIK
ncbi:MAG: polar amino acid transport system substrate-binding protein [Alteromonadaceae bacterium]